MHLAGYALLAIGALSAAAVRADVFELKQGGQVVGKLIDRKDSRYVIKTSEGAEVTLDRDQLERIMPANPAEAEYLQRSRTAPDDADSHRKLAAWCTERGLKDEAEHHLRRVVELDPTDEQARASLGFMRVGKRWLTRDEVMRERGMVMFEGKWRTPQDIAIRQRSKSQEAVAVDWLANLRKWRGWLDNRRPERVAEAQQLIATLEDPAATPALVKLLDAEKQLWVFELLLDALGRMDHPLAVQTLVGYSLDHEDAEIRARAIDYLMSSGRPVSILPYVQALKSPDNYIVNRAATALGRIGDPAAISPLIDALTTRHKYQVSAGQPGQIGAAFDPAGGGGGFSFGGNGPKIVEQEKENLGVHRALVKLSGNKDLDYNKRAWRRWYVDLLMREHINARRDN